MNTIGLAYDRADQTALSRFVSGHLRSCSFSHGNKVFPVCAKCGVASASPEHILSCLRLSREAFETDPLLALDFLRVSTLRFSNTSQQITNNDNNCTLNSAQLTISHCRRNSKVVSVDHHTTIQYRSASNSLLARTADRSPKRDSKEFVLQGDPSRSTRSKSINIHSVIQAYSLYSLLAAGRDVTWNHQAHSSVSPLLIEISRKFQHL
ncbi:hypothetical protein AVEN_23300-1 [Araneus ventricosus]|uniref:Uncharacterized protein n=1 Tax=Araneus ventricosus TaxID=182803 RepID=A0A4Y2QNJ5_ARAVE|nr:hypothetical protein AVEN_23300-1 [Araneus ventricosus]